MIKDLTKAYGIEVSFSYGDNPCIHIKDSYKVTSGTDMEVALRHIHQSSEYVELQHHGYNRSFASELREWKGHNILYRFGILRDRTGSVDIDQNEPKWRRVIYALLSAL